MEDSPQARRVRIERRIPGRSVDSRVDDLAVEEPLEIRIGDEVFAVVMRTPGHDLELVSGLLLAEGVIESPTDVEGIVHCRDVPADAQGNVVLVALHPDRPYDPDEFRRNLLSSSACGVCGKDTVERLRQRAPKVTSEARVAADVLQGLPAELRSDQHVFDRTGGLHAAGLFRNTGERLIVREDVGRHNAVDKVVGAALRHDLLPLDTTVLMVSGRASFEIIQKARVAGIPVVAAVSAPSSLAVELADDGGQTLAGFVRPDGFNVYCGAQRLT